MQNVWISKLVKNELFKGLDAFHINLRRTISKNEKMTHFGFEIVKEKEKERRVYKVFENVAENYDLMNDIMSGGIHRLWKDYFMLRMQPVPGTHLIDVAGGTGDIAFRFLKYIDNASNCDSDQSLERKEDFKTINGIVTNDEMKLKKNVEVVERRRRTHVTVCDINQAMLNVGQRRAVEQSIQSGITWLQGNAEMLPVKDNSYDVYTVAFGIRNMTHIDKVLSEAYRVLKRGGKFMCLEFSQVSNSFLRSVYDEYSFQVIPVMGKIVAGDWESYQYLVESIRNFPKQEEFAEQIRSAGFKFVTYDNLLGGVAAIHSGLKL